MATLGIASHAQQDVGGRSSVALSLTLMAVGADSPPRRQSVSFRFISIHLPHKRPRCVRDGYAARRLTLPYAVDDWSPNARVSGDLSVRFVGMRHVSGPLRRRGRRHSLKVRSASRPHVLAVVALLIAAAQCWVSATWRVVYATMVWGIPQMPPSTIPPPFSCGTEKGARTTRPVELCSNARRVSMVPLIAAMRSGERHCAGQSKGRKL